ncbi:MAG TPA: ATP-dependent helicase [Oscillospiraceae bacterium]|jgi:DNA helicase-2/ATP-dependent DNA helicase PcrA|nr:ATP-dependent helicase [Oscillospiraceae bacterium]
MFDYGNANEAQREAINSTNGLVLITAGPGTGKTFTLVKRAVYLIQECGVKPEQIMMATFTEKAAKELITRITNELAKGDISVNVNEMYIGTFHSLCLRIIKENLEFTRLKRNYRLLDTFDQKYLVFRNYYKFKNIDGVDELLSRGGTWKRSDEICNYVNHLSEEMVDVEALQKDTNPEIGTLGKILSVYQEMLEEGNLIDFSTIQTECFRLLKDNQKILEELQNKLQYLMIDEYQDTNYIQEQIVFLIGAKHHNICVVGDDDQGLYRFRGATIRNILEFPYKFQNENCKVIPLVVNYRSNSDIVDFYNEWMSTTSGANFKFEWDKYRYEKQIVPHEKSSIQSPAVVKLFSKDDEDEWHEKILEFIIKLKESGKLSDYNQLAFLFSSVKHQRVTALANFLEKSGINVYSPRSDMFFKRDEIKLAIGCLMLMFPKYVLKFEKQEFEFLQAEHYRYYKECIVAANEYVTKPENKELLQFIRSHGKAHAGLTGTTDYAYSGLLYKLFMYKPFSDILDTDMSVGVVDIRPTRNLALLTQIIGKFEYLHRVDVLNGSYIDKNTELLFNLYLKLLYDGGISEYEDEAEYAPSGCVSFLTIHQSKGMEFPIVFVDSLSNAPRKTYKDLMTEVEDKYFHRPSFEPYEQTKYFDFWRLYYTAFSRAQDLLVLTCDENKRTPSQYFRDIYDEVPSVDNANFDLTEFDFQSVKKVNLKNSFSFTSHITVYETCALQYKFYKELEFMPVRQNAMMFGTLVHETIEDVHRAAIRGEVDQINNDNIASWFESNYNSLVKSEHTYLAEPQRNAALNQVKRYAERMDGKWETVQQAEVDVSLVKEDYIIDGKIDLVKGVDGTVEIVDFKSERKPDMVKMRDRLEHYRRQLQIYAYLIEQRTGQKVSKMHLYYTAEENGNPMITYPYTRTAIDGTVAAFDDTVHKILKKDFNHRCDDAKTCRNCDFRYYCQNR